MFRPEAEGSLLPCVLGENVSWGGGIKVVKREDLRVF